MESGGLVQEQGSGAVALQSGTRLGGYELGARLGVGSMGAVYEGVRTRDGKRVAIKVLGAELAKQPTARARFLDEGKLTARVRHPNIVEVIETGEDDDRAFLVMERLEGEDLGQRIRAGAMAIADAVDLLIPVCDAVATAHRRGITHRDLKPSNIFLTVRDGRTHPIVLDFGIAKQDDSAAARAGQTPGSGPRVMFGTPYYFAPEQVADHRSAGPASDQYALGVILYECLTGERPYGGDDMDQLFKVIVAGNAPPPRTRRSDIPAELESVVLRAMSPKPGKRFPTVADFGKALLPFVSSPAELAPSPAERAAAGRRRPPSSPAIEAEAATPSPFNRTLSPESQGESGPWFLAPPSPEDSSEETTLRVSAPSTASGRAAEDPLRKTILGFPSDRGSKSVPAPERVSNRAPAPAPELHRAPMSPLELSEPEPPWTDPSAKRRRTRLLAVAGAGAVSVICLIVVVASGGSDRAVAPSVSTVQTLPHPSPEPSQPTPQPEVAKSAPTPEPASPSAVTEAPLPKSKPATVSPEASTPKAPSAQAARKKSESAAVVPTANPKPARPSSTHMATGEPAAPAVAVKRPSAPAQRPAQNVGRKPASPAPRAVNVATAGVRPERPAPALTGEGAPRERPAPPHPRESSSTGVKAHNGVPLLD